MVMDRGRLLAIGSPRQVQDNAEVRAIYLGEEGGHANEGGAIGR